MYIVFAAGLPDETVCVETKKEAVAIATLLTTENTVSFGVYKSTLVAQAVTGVFVQKVKQGKAAKQETEPATEKPVKKAKPALDPMLQIIAAEDAIAEGPPIPVGARCALDNNMAVGSKKGPTGEFVYLCLDCMGEVDKNE